MYYPWYEWTKRSDIMNEKHEALDIRLFIHDDYPMAVWAKIN